MLRSSPRRFRNTPLRVVQINSKRADGRVDSYWTVTPLKNEEGKRFRPHFATKAEAEAEKGRRERERRLVGIEGSQMSSALRVDAINAQRILAPLGATLLTAARHYAGYLEKSANSAASKTVDEAKDEYLLDREKEFSKKEIALVTIRNNRSRMKVISSGLKNNKDLPALGNIRLPDVSHVEIAAFLRNLPFRTQTKAHYRAQIHSFFEYAREKGWVTSNPALQLGRSKKKTEGEGARILKSSQVRDLLDAAEASPLARILVPRLALGLFLGLRPEETARMDWKDIDFAQGHVRVRKTKSKKKQERYVELNPTAKAWLLKYRTAEGPIFSSSQGTIRKAWDKLRKQCGWKFASFPTDDDDFEKNVLRHSFGSYMLAKTQNRARTTELMGTSLSTFASYYRVALPEKSAESYWNILPDTSVRPKTKTTQKT